VTNLSGPAVKPLLRGHFHQAAFFFAMGACSLLLVDGGVGRIFPLLIYSISLCGLLGVSALYHRKHWQVRGRAWMRRLDHAFIFILIAGTATPICLWALPPAEGPFILVVLWAATAVGVLQSLFWGKAPKWVAAILYVGVGWIVVPYFSDFQRALSTTQVGLLLGGGIIYTVGAVVYALKKPNPWPPIFGYHEIFHLLVIVAATFHFVVIYGLSH